MNDSPIMGHFIEEMVPGRFTGTVNQFKPCICVERKVAFYVNPSRNKMLTGNM